MTTQKDRASAKTIGSYLNEPLTVGEPDVSGPLAVFPIFGVDATQRFVSFAQGREAGAVTIKEVGSVDASPYSFVVTFTAEKIEKVILGGEWRSGRTPQEVASSGDPQRFALPHSELSNGCVRASYLRQTQSLTSA